MKDHVPFLVGLRKVVVWTFRLRIHLAPFLAQHLADLGDLQIGICLLRLETGRKKQSSVGYTKVTRPVIMYESCYKWEGVAARADDASWANIFQAVRDKNNSTFALITSEYHRSTTRTEREGYIANAHN